MRKLLDRTQKDIEEEQMLLNELKKIEARKKERDRKTQDLQKLISQADQVCHNKQIHVTSLGYVVKLFVLIEFFFFFKYSKAKHPPRRPAPESKRRRLTKRKSQAKFGHQELMLS